jgi:hypothetical protein
MNKFVLPAAILALSACPVFAQTSTEPTQAPPTPPTVANPPANSTNPTAATAPPTTTTTTNNGAEGSSAAPGNVIQSPVEQNRLDPSAPSPDRLQIDEGSVGDAATNPDTNSSNPGAPGQSYNAIVQGAPSNSGIGTGTSGLGVTPPASAMSPSTYPHALTPPMSTPSFSPSPTLGSSGIGSRGFSASSMAGSHSVGGHR